MLRNSLAEIGAGNARDLLKTEVLPSYVRERRWFQQKDFKKRAPVDIAMIGEKMGAEENLLYVEITVQSGERRERYALPVAVAWEDEPLSRHSRRLWRSRACARAAAWDC